MCYGGGIRFSLGAGYYYTEAATAALIIKIAHQAKDKSWFARTIKHLCTFMFAEREHFVHVST